MPPLGVTRDLETSGEPLENEGGRRCYIATIRLIRHRQCSSQFRQRHRGTPSWPRPCIGENDGARVVYEIQAQIIQRAEIAAQKDVWWSNGMTKRHTEKG